MQQHREAVLQRLQESARIREQREQQRVSPPRARRPRVVAAVAAAPRVLHRVTVPDRQVLLQSLQQHAKRQQHERGPGPVSGSGQRGSQPSGEERAARGQGSESGGDSEEEASARQPKRRRRRLQLDEQREHGSGVQEETGWAEAPRPQHLHQQQQQQQEWEREPQQATRPKPQQQRQRQQQQQQRGAQAADEDSDDDVQVSCCCKFNMVAQCCASLHATQYRSSTLHMPNAHGPRLLVRGAPRHLVAV